MHVAGSDRFTLQLFVYISVKVCCIHAKEYCRQKCCPVRVGTAFVEEEPVELETIVVDQPAPSTKCPDLATCDSKDAEGQKKVSLWQEIVTCPLDERKSYLGTRLFPYVVKILGPARYNFTGLVVSRILEMDPVEIVRYLEHPDRLPDLVQEVYDRVDNEDRNRFAVVARRPSNEDDEDRTYLRCLISTTGII